MRRRGGRIPSSPCRFPLRNDPPHRLSSPAPRDHLPFSSSLLGTTSSLPTLPSPLLPRARLVADCRLSLPIACVVSPPLPLPPRRVTHVACCATAAQRPRCAVPDWGAVRGRPTMVRPRPDRRRGCTDSPPPPTCRRRHVAIATAVAPSPPHRCRGASWGPPTFPSARRPTARHVARTAASASPRRAHQRWLPTCAIRSRPPMRGGSRTRMRFVRTLYQADVGTLHHDTIHATTRLCRLLTPPNTQAPPTHDTRHTARPRKTKISQ